MAACSPKPIAPVKGRGWAWSHVLTPFSVQERPLTGTIELAGGQPDGGGPDGREMSEFKSVLATREYVIRALEQVDEILYSDQEAEFNLGADLRDCLRPALRVLDAYCRAEAEGVWKYAVSLGQESV